MRDEFRVVKINSEWEIVINAGANKELKIGDKLEIFVIGTPIIDPDTKVNLGTLDSIKAIVEVVQVYENMAVCKNSLFEPSSMEIISNAAAMMITRPRKKLNVEIEEMTESGYVKEPIKIGDKVRLVL